MFKLQNILSPIFSKSTHKVGFDSPVFFIGSCFSQNISSFLSQRKFNVLSNPYGILFDVLSIERCIAEVCALKNYIKTDLFLFNELFGSWNHHSSFSDLNEEFTLAQINDSIINTYEFLKSAESVIITLGSAFSYFHIEENIWVSNCHKVPQTQFRKELITVEKIIKSLENIRALLLKLNPKIHLMVTISPVRHLRDGVVDNNRSKARLIEAVNLFTHNHSEVYYFPSYEIVIDVLRDYRYYDIDFAHPNYLATEIVFEYFKDLCIEPKHYDNMDKFYSLYLAMNHRTKHPGTNIHLSFLESNLSKTIEYAKAFPKLNFQRELIHFENEIKNLKIRS
jgi:hypothetical protein